MKHLLLSLLALTPLFAAPVSTSAPAAPFHCQVPCGIYGDTLRIQMLLEDTATIEKGMVTLNAMDQEQAPSENQRVRWILTKDEHAQAIQDQVAAYWLAQRIKTPKADADEAALAKYHHQLELMHRLTVSAMKCKQTTDVEHVAELRRLCDEFSGTYFSAEDLEHLRGHNAGK
ncbi:MAG: superoxide dismutase [Planctomycetes bacterium]|nr:superoxide dismutase [Planctomycetota bacterium]